MNSLEESIIIQNEIDKCNENMKKYDIKYNTEKIETIKILYNYLKDQLLHCDDIEEKLVIDDINILTHLLVKIINLLFYTNYSHNLLIMLHLKFYLYNTL